MCNDIIIFKFKLKGDPLSVWCPGAQLILNPGLTVLNRFVFTCVQTIRIRLPYVPVLNGIVTLSLAESAGHWKFLFSWSSKNNDFNPIMNYFFYYTQLLCVCIQLVYTVLLNGWRWTELCGVFIHLYVSIRAELVSPRYISATRAQVLEVLKFLKIKLNGI
jgi:hypothetical protein